jgi:hypothetical protein
MERPELAARFDQDVHTGRDGKSGLVRRAEPADAIDGRPDEAA